MVKRVAKKQPSALNTEVAFTLNIDEASGLESIPKKTFVLFGNPRGGTTMIANVVRSMGVYLGDDLPVNLEDDDFNWDVLSKNPDLKRPEKIASIKQAIERRNLDHDVWGWKYPRTDAYFNDVLSEIVNPMLICVFRDVVASTWRNVVRKRQPPIQVIRRALDLQAKNLGLIEKSGAPALLISYEKAIAEPLQLASSLNQFMGLGLSDGDLAEHAKRVDPELGYKASQI